MTSLPWSYGIEAMRERRELRGSEENSISILEKQKTIDIPCQIYLQKIQIEFFSIFYDFQ